MQERVLWVDICKCEVPIQCRKGCANRIHCTLWLRPFFVRIWNSWGNIYWEGTVSLIKRLTKQSQSIKRPPRDTAKRQCRSATLPWIAMPGGYPSGSTKFEVLVHLHEKNLVKKVIQYDERKEGIAQRGPSGDIRCLCNLPISSRFVSSITISPEEDGTWWLCTDYKAVNNQKLLILFEAENRQHNRLNRWIHLIFSYRHLQLFWGRCFYKKTPRKTQHWQLHLRCMNAVDFVS